MKKQVIVDQVTVKSDGVFEIRFKKQIVDTDGTILGAEYHRTICEPFVPIENQLAVVEQDLARGSWPAVDSAGHSMLVRLAASEHTPAKADARRKYLDSVRDSV